MTDTPYYTPSDFSFPHRKNELDAAFFWVVLAVVVIHGAMTWMALLPSNQKPKVSQQQKVLVRTVKLHPKSQSIHISSPVTTTTALASPSPVIQETPKEIAQAAPAPSPQPVQEPKPEPIKKVETPKEEVKKIEPKIETPVKQEKPVPEKKPTATPKKTVVQAPKNPAPAKSKPKAEVKKQPTAKETAAKEAEKAKQKEIAAAKEEAKKKQIAEEAEVKKRQQAAEEATRKIQQAAQAEVQKKQAAAMEKFAQLSQSWDKVSAVKVAQVDEGAAPRHLETLQIDALPSDSAIPMETSYRDELAYRLKHTLKMPDYGQVKIKLTLERSGKVANVQIVSSESAKNKQYVEKMIPTLVFPPFGTRFQDAKQYSFMITLKNE